MVLDRDHLTQQELIFQEDLDRSWTDAMATLDDPGLRAGLVDSLVRLDQREPSALIDPAEFMTGSELAAH